MGEPGGVLARGGLSNTMDTSLAVDALEEALAQLWQARNLQNTDQGSQVTSAVFTGVLAAAEVQSRWMGAADAMDNVFIEAAGRS